MFMAENVALNLKRMLRVTNLLMRKNFTAGSHDDMMCVRSCLQILAVKNNLMYLKARTPQTDARGNRLFL